MIICTLCGGSDAKVCIEGPGTWHCYEPSIGRPFHYTVALCRRCGHVFGNWQADQVHRYSDEEYVTREESLPVDCAYTTFCLAGLPRYKHRATRVLEIGFNRGALMKHFYDFGFECHGIEPGPRNVEFARSRMPDARLDCGLFTADWARQYEPGYFDLVILTSVFEHMPQPMDVLNAIRPLVQDQGRLFLLVPDLAQYTPTYQVRPQDRDRYGCSPLNFFYRDFFLCYAQHINHFSAASLSRYLGAAGFEVAQMANISGLWYLARPAKPTASRYDYPDLVRYHSDLMDYYADLLRRMREAMLARIVGRRLVCYGAGRDFGYFLDVFEPMGIRPLAVADDSAGVSEIRGIPVVRPYRLAEFAPEICLATSFDYEDQIARKARAILRDRCEVLTLTQLNYELDIEVPSLTRFSVGPTDVGAAIVAACGART
ncbi:MAG: hypothetical protein AMXMBFR47_10590 [Planctomycetota bacterium]